MSVAPQRVKAPPVFEQAVVAKGIILTGVVPAIVCRPHRYVKRLELILNKRIWGTELAPDTLVLGPTQQGRTAKPVLRTRSAELPTVLTSTLLIPSPSEGHREGLVAPPLGTSHWAFPAGVCITPRMAAASCLAARARPSRFFSPRGKSTPSLAGVYGVVSPAFAPVPPPSFTVPPPTGRKKLVRDSSVTRTISPCEVLEVDPVAGR